MGRTSVPSTSYVDFNLHRSNQPPLHFAQYDGTPGRKYDDFVMLALNAMAGKMDERGFSLADHIKKTDEGGDAAATDDAMPNANTAAGVKALAARRRRRRARESYSLIVTHISDPGIVRELWTQYLQDGIGACSHTRHTAAKREGKVR